MARYFLKLSYKGGAYNGWQVQENTPNTVQQVLEDKMTMLLKEKIALTGCGRTDTGVHAKNYYAHFDAQMPELLSNKQQWLYKLNTVLPADIAVNDLLAVVPTAHARFDAIERQYFYYISREKNPFRSAYTWYVYGALDFELMNKAAAMLLEYQDFTSFSKLNTQNKTNNCTITKAQWQQTDEQEWRFNIRANRFLRGMVRAIAGTLVLVGKNKISLQDFRNIIEAKNRALAGGNAPAHPLFLSGIRYPNSIFLDQHENK